MFKTLNLPSNEFSLSESLLYICKKPSGNSAVESKPEIDFLLLDDQIEGLQHIQSKTCQHIVQYVDENREKFIEINGKFASIQGQIQNTELILKNIVPKITNYKQKHYSSESKIQEYITNYEKKLIQKKFIQIAKQEANFLINYVKEFEKFINLNVQELSHMQKYYIIRLLKKNQYLKNLFDHPFVKIVGKQYHGLDNLVDNVVQELQFYLSQQLSRLISKKQLYNTIGSSNLTLFEEIKTWYQYNNKAHHFYANIEQTLLIRQLPVLQSHLVSGKQSLLTGKEENLLVEFYSNLFKLINNFPEGYPADRILKIIYKFLYKKQLNFQYSYVVPTFAISYSAYKDSLKIINNDQIRRQLSNQHNWKLSLWAELRIKSIMDRSSKDFNLQTSKILTKWFDIIFKKGFMIKGVKSYMIKLAFMLVNKYCQNLEQLEFNPKNLNDCIEDISSAKSILCRKLKEGFQQQLQQSMNKLQSSEQIQSHEQDEISNRIKQIIHNIINSLRTQLTRWVTKNIMFIISSCRNSFQNYKSFVMKIVSNKKQKLKGQINKKQVIQKPFDGYLKNNSELTVQSIDFLQEILWENLKIYYDGQYAKDIYNHSNNNLTTEQMKNVMEVLSLERTVLFEKQKNKVAQN